VAIDCLLRYCGWIQAYFIQLHGDDLMLELAGNSSDDVRDKAVAITALFQLNTHTPTHNRFTDYSD